MQVDPVTSNLTHVQAAMFLWMRRSLTSEMFQSLTGRSDFDDLSALQVEDSLLSAFERDEVATVVDELAWRSNIRAGKLPIDLLQALNDYSDSLYNMHIESNMYDSKRLKGEEDSEKLDEGNEKLKKNFYMLCNEIAKIRVA